MTHFSDGLWMGGASGGPASFILPNATENPTLNEGAGPLGRVAFLNIVPAVLSTNALAVTQAVVGGTPMTLRAQVFTSSLVPAPGGSGVSALKFDCNRCVSLTSGSDASAVHFLITGFDMYGRPQTQLMLGPNGNTVTSLKAFLYVVSIVPDASSAASVQVGNSDIFGLPFAAVDAVYIVQAKWNNILAANAGTFVAADPGPSFAISGDPRGTFAQAGAASDGTKRLVVTQHLGPEACGPLATLVGAIGATPR